MARPGARSTLARTQATDRDIEAADDQRAARDFVRCDHHFVILRSAHASSSEYFRSRISATIDARRVAG